MCERSRSVLCDVLGYWHPDTEEFRQKLIDYTAMVRPGNFPTVLKDGRVPASCTVFEELGRPPQATTAPVHPRERRTHLAAGQTENQPARGDHYSGVCSRCSKPTNPEGKFTVDHWMHKSGAGERRNVANDVATPTADGAAFFKFKRRMT